MSCAALRLQVVDPVELVRPGDAVAGDVPFPAADVGQGLRLGEADGGLPERRGGRVPLRDRGAQREQADGDDREEALQDLHRDGLVVPAERHVVGDDAGHAEPRQHEARGHRAELREANGGPEEEREEEVRVAPEPAEEDGRAQPCQRGEQDGALQRCARRRSGVGGRVAQTRMSGATRRAPVASPSHQRSQREP